jgi:integrase
MGKPFRINNSKGQPRWYTYVTYKGDRKRKVAGSTKADALRYQRKLENQLERDKGASIRDKKIPFDYLCDEYLKIAETNLGKQTVRERRIAIKAHLKPFFVCYAGDISENDIEAYKRDRTEVSPATINNELKVLSCIFKFGIQFGFLVDMPKIKRLKVPVKNPVFLSEDQVSAILSAAEPRVRPMLQLLIFTGMRKGEMAHLEWTDINWKRRQIHIQPKKDWSPKSARPRTIEINTHAMEALQEAKRRNEKRVPPSLLVFPGRKGYLGDIRDGLNHACDRAGIGRVTVHQLRHTCASLMVMKGSDLPSVAATLGHRDIATTMIYAHLTQDHIKSQMNKLDGVAIPKICPKSAQKPKKTKKGKPAKTGIPFGIALVPKAGFEPARVSPPPPQDGVSASSTTSARCREKYSIHPPAENQYGVYFRERFSSKTARFLVISSDNPLAGDGHGGRRSAAPRRLVPERDQSCRGDDLGG